MKFGEVSVYVFNKVNKTILLFLWRVISYYNWKIPVSSIMDQR